MAKEKVLVGLSRDCIIHPGETLAEIIEDRGMRQRELSVRTGVSEKHISTIIHGKKGISTSFARKLEYALGIEALFWINLQNNYERELLEFEELNNITEDEINLIKKLKEVIEKWEQLGWLDREANPATMILDLRRIFGISNLLDTPKITYNAAYRAQIKNTNVDPYVLFAWQRMCEMLTEKVDIADSVNTEMLREKIPDIKQIMFLEEQQIKVKLTHIFAECGIAFDIVPNFKGAPVQGFIKKKDDDSLILCMTPRQKFKDIFWFTLFHEIAHILNGDTKNEFVDFDSISNTIEEKADSKASGLLIDTKVFNAFVRAERYKQPSEIKALAESQNVKDFIVLGRLMKENVIPWKARERYEWVDPKAIV